MQLSLKIRANKFFFFLTRIDYDLKIIKFLEMLGVSNFLLRN
jgi:hypothetical protein